MAGLVVKESARLDTAQEIARLEALLEEKRAELKAAQEELRAFKERYARIVGRKYIELAHVERAIKRAESALFNLPEEDLTDEIPAFNDDKAGETSQVKNSLRKMFWKVAQLFHPDHASDDKESARRHAVMSEATRAYQDGDADKLAELLGDDDLKFFCATAGETNDGAFDPAEYILELKDELRTLDYGLRRVRQDPLHHVMRQTQAAHEQGRDDLQETAARLERRLKKARNRLVQLGGALEDTEAEARA
jgi:hypothetical protein